MPDKIHTLTAVDLVIGTKPKTKRRKPSMADAARLSAKEGVEVKIETDGTTVTVTPAKPLDITPTETETNEWDRLQ